MLDQAPLSAYTDEIRTLIQAGHNDDAMSLCRHVLSHYPKHIDTYRQMAEASLEKGDQPAAQELFRRVLSADPENVVAYAGLAIILERQGARQEALWHLERALELAPANVEIRKELLRVYGEINGKPQARIKLTPGALARLYLQEGLYPQAIQEFQTLVSNAPDRVDLRVALLETLWRGGRKRQAAELAQEVLQVLPFCLKANLILGTMLNEGDTDQGADHLQRARALDPSHRVAQELLGSRAQPVPAPMVPSVTGSHAAGPEPEPASATGSTSGEWSTQPSYTETDVEEPEVEQAVEMVAPMTDDSVVPPVDEKTASAADGETTPVEITASSGLLGYVVSDASDKSQAATLVTPPQADTALTAEEISNLPAWLMDNPSSNAPAAVEPPVAIEPPTTATPTSTSETTAMPAWLVDADEPKPAEPEVDTPAEAQSAERYIAPFPNWLTDLQEPDMPSIATLAPSEPSSSPAANSLEATDSTESLLAGILGETPTPEESQGEPAFPGGEMPQLLIEEEVETSTPAVPTSHSDSSAAPEVQAAEPDSGSEEKEQAVAVPAPMDSAPTGAVVGESQTEGARRLEQARSWRDSKRLGEALVDYDRVVTSAPELVNQVIRDLEGLLQQEDAPLEAHRVLGDAYARAGRLTDALGQYRFVLDRVS